MKYSTIIEGIIILALCWGWHSNTKKLHTTIAFLRQNNSVEEVKVVETVTLNNKSAETIKELTESLAALRVTNKELTNSIVKKDALIAKAKAYIAQTKRSVKSTKPRSISTKFPYNIESVKGRKFVSGKKNAYVKVSNPSEMAKKHYKYKIKMIDGKYYKVKEAPVYSYKVSFLYTNYKDSNSALTVKCGTGSKTIRTVKDKPTASYVISSNKVSTITFSAQGQTKTMHIY